MARGESVQAAPRLVLLLDFDDDDAVAALWRDVEFGGTRYFRARSCS